MQDKIDILAAQQEFQGLQDSLETLERGVLEMASRPHGALLARNLKALKADIRNLDRAILFATPFRECPACPDGPECKFCKSTGFLNREQYKLLPTEYRE